MDIVSWSLGNENYNQDKPLYIDCNDPTRWLSAKDVRKYVRQLVSGFKQQNLSKGDCVCVISLNDIYYTSLYLGIIGAGGCFTGANPGYTAHELTHHLRVTQAKFLLTSVKTLGVSIAAADSCGIPRSRIFVLNLENESVPCGHRSWYRLLKCGEKDWEQVEDPNETPAAYISTSGTSGTPKAAVIPHSYLVSQAQFQVSTSAARYKVSNLMPVPPFHVFAIPAQHSLPLRKGVATYIMPRFEIQSFIAAVAKFRIAHTFIVPPILIALANHPESSQLKSLKRIYIGGSCATDGMQQKLYVKLSPSAMIEQVYGMTETGWATMWHDRKQENTGSVGRPLPGTTLRLVDTDGQTITEEGIKGEIHIHCPHPMKGYLNNEAATKEAFSPDGWVRTGDIGYVRGGKWYVVDRSKDLIKVRGWQVSPGEIEAVLLEHPGIADAGVIGVQSHSDASEVPVAYVVRKNLGLDEKEVRRFLGTKLARYKMVTGVTFVDSIPRNPTGKILRRVLRDGQGASPPRTSQAAASAYSSAIKDLKRYQQEHSPVNSSESDGHVGSRESSPTSSLSESSVITRQSPRTPPQEIPHKVAIAGKTSEKRTGESLFPDTVKRRSIRIARIRV